MKSKIKLFAVLFICSFSSLTYAQDSVPETGGDYKACVLSVTSQTHADVDCVGTGAVCTSILDCFAIFKPATPGIN